MKRISIDLESATTEVEDEHGRHTYPLDSPEAFRAVSRAWLRCGWDTKHVYSFTWLGRPVIQLPEDLLRLQEVIHRVQPDVIVETGIAHGGSLIFHASLCHAMDRGRVVGVDIEIRPHNRAAIESHPMAGYITMIEGSSTAPEVVQQVRDQITDGETVMVILDSNHTLEHVRGELDAYHGLVTPGSYIVACDGIMGEVVGAPRTEPDWAWNHPAAAAIAFGAAHPEFRLQDPDFAFNEGMVDAPVTYWPNAWLQRLS